MYHFIGVAIALLIQYVVIYYSMGLLYRFYKRYEIDLETADKPIELMTKSDSKHGSEYSMLINEEDDSI